MDDESAVLAANDAFYVAFATGDIEAMGRLWADRPQVSCVHPGWAPLFGRAEVMASWRAVLAKPPAVTVDEARVAEVRSALEQGRYTIRPDRIADQLLELERALEKLGHGE